jgi:hypothetical protein
MNFIATYWWVWLAGIMVVLAMIFVRSIMNTLGLASDIVEIVSRLRLAMQAPVEERRRQFTDLGLEVSCDKIKKRAIGYFVNIGFALLGGGCGILLVLALIQHVIVYLRSSG